MTTDNGEIGNNPAHVSVSGRVWRNRYSGQRLIETSDRHDNVVVMKSKIGADVPIAIDALCGDEWEAVGEVTASNMPAGDMPEDAADTRQSGSETSSDDPLNLLFPYEIGRLGYLIRLICLLGVLLLFATSQTDGRIFIVVLIAAFIFKFPFMIIPRLRSIGWSPWMAVCMFIPFVNFLFLLIFLLWPPYSSSSGSD